MASTENRSRAPFNLDRAIKGAKLVTRNGSPVEFIAHVPGATLQGERVLCLHLGRIETYSVEGWFDMYQMNCGLDLFMAEPAE